MECKRQGETRREIGKAAKVQQHKLSPYPINRKGKNNNHDTKTTTFKIHPGEKNTESTTQPRLNTRLPTETFPLQFSHPTNPESKSKPKPGPRHQNIDNHKVPGTTVFQDHPVRCVADKRHVTLTMTKTKSTYPDPRGSDSDFTTVMYVRLGYADANDLG